MKPVKKALLLLVCLSICYSLIACGVVTITTNEPPTLRVSHQGSEITADTGTYSWTVKKLLSGHTTFADSVNPAELVKKSAPLIVSPKSSLTLNFDRKPKTIEVSIWHKNNSEKQSLVNGKIEVPAAKGDFVYLVVGTFEQGTVSYAFKVTVN
ncbi:MAG: hypothetical protein M0Z55_00385 [Peptococcaceae bacterium]|nr:hypothetical protein [Peptococcaceae bacterium]